MKDLENISLKKLSQNLKKKKVKAVEVAKYYLDQIEKNDVEINSYLEVFGDALESAKESDERIENGEARELEGVPVAVKDNIQIKGKTVTAASKILKGHKAVYDATVIQKLREAGAVFLGRTNMDEFAMGSSTEYSAYKKTRNPHDVSRVPGGSSGGSAAAVAAGLAPIALGSDTAGSIRQPAALTGLVGLKPTYGSVSRYGLIALGSSLDVIGPIARSVDDAKLLWNIIKGRDPKDVTSVSEDLYEKKNVRKPIIGVPDFVFEGGGMEDDALQSFKDSLKTLLDMGYEIKEISLPNIKYAVSAYYVLLPAEASSNLARFDGFRYGDLKEDEDLWKTYLKTRGQGFGREVRRRIILGTYVLSAGYYDAYYAQAQRVRSMIRKDFKAAFESVDVIVTPTTTGPAFRFGEKTEDPVKMYLEDIFTVPANHAGLPAISIPSGSVTRDGKDLPLGIHFTASHMREDLLFDLGQDFIDNIQ